MIAGLQLQKKQKLAELKAEAAAMTATLLHCVVWNGTSHPLTLSCSLEYTVMLCNACLTEQVLHLYNVTCMKTVVLCFILVSFNVPFCRLQIATIFNLQKATTDDNSIERYIFKVIFVSTTGKVREYHMVWLP